MQNNEPRRSRRNRQPIDRLQPEGRRQVLRPVPYQQHARNRRLQQQQQQQHRQQQRQDAQQAARNGVPTTFQEIKKKILHDDRDSIIPESKMIQFKLPAAIREISGSKKTKISECFGDDGTQFRNAHSKYNMGDFDQRPHFDEYSRLQSNK